MADDFVDLADNAFRDFTIDGMPSSGRHKPVKSEVREIFVAIKEVTDATSVEVETLKLAQRSNHIVLSTWAELAAYPTDNLITGSGAEVVDDAGTHTDPVVGGTVDNEGVYSYVEGDGWQRVADLGVAVLDARLTTAEGEIDTLQTEIVTALTTTKTLGPSRSGLFVGDAAMIDRNLFGVTNDAATFDAWVNGGQAYISVNDGPVQITADTETTYVHALIRDGLLSVVRADNKRFATPLAGSYPELDAATTTIEYSDLYGQSVAAGNASGAVVNGTASGIRHLMFGAGARTYGNFLAHSQERTRPQQPVYDAIHDFAYAHEQLVDGAGETSNSGFGYGLLNNAGVASVLASTSLLTTCSAVGSANQEMLWKVATENTDAINTIGDPWSNLESRFVRAALFWRLQGFQFVAGPLRHNQGEGNINRTKANHLAGLEQFRDDWQALAQAWNALRVSGGFPGKAPLVVAQTCSGQKYSNGAGGYYVESEVPWAQLQISLDDPTTALCIGPTYDQVYAADGVHLQSLGQEMQGARQAVAYGEWLKGNTWHPLCVRKDGANRPTRTGTTVRCKIWNHFNLALTFDTTTITGLGAGQGFEWFDNGDGNSVTVTNAAIIDSTTVDLTLSAVPTGTGGAIDIGMTGAGNANSGPTTGNRATLRTNGSGVTTRGGRAVEHFICIDRVPVI